jgi:hypothetical protein
VVASEQARHAVQFLKQQRGLPNADIERTTGLGHKFVATWAPRTSVKGPPPLISEEQGAALLKQVFDRWLKIGSLGCLAGR